MRSMVSSWIRRFIPGAAARVCLGVDLVVLGAALVFAAQPAFTWVTVASLLLATCVWLVVSSTVRHYAPHGTRSLIDDAVLGILIVLAVATVLVPLTLVRGLQGAPDVGYFLMVALPALLVLRFVLCLPLLARGREPARVLVVGTGPLGRLTGEDIARRERPRRQKVHGYLSFPGDPVPDRIKALHLGTVAELELCLRMLTVDEVYIAGNSVLQGDAMQAATRVCETLGIPFALPAYSQRLERAQPVDPRTVSDGYLHFTCVKTHQPTRELKRLLDVLASAAMLWVLAPLLTVVGILIKITSPGPVFFRQLRVGQHGRLFHILKFRSMVADAEGLKQALQDKNEQTGPVFKIRNDPRVTALGRVMRKFSIDELPQLINVLRGDMTLVGPRPPVPKEVAQYEPWQLRRLSVVPGLTCIWQVSGRNSIAFQEWMYLDLRYIDTWSLGQDLNLLMKTVPAVVAGRGQ